VVDSCKRGNERSESIGGGGMYFTSRMTVSFSRRTVCNKDSQTCKIVSGKN
jgi:hypothetical protein